MKKRKYKKNKRNNKKIKKSKHNIILICLIVYIIIVVIIAIFYIMRFKSRNITKNELYNNDIITYMGEKISKKKLITEFLSRVSDDDNIVGHEKQRFSSLFYLPEYSDNHNLRNNIKNSFMNMFSKIKNKNISNIETFFITNNVRFGNNIITINNVIFYCEIIGCNKIILNYYHVKRNWLIKNPIYIQKFNITIMLGKNVNCNDEKVFCIQASTWDPFYPIFIKPEIRTEYIKDELLRNLPIVHTKPDDLYIHIRGGDIFKPNPSTAYAQPPLCFYERIINNNKFNDIYIISMDRRNIVLNALLNKYKNIIYKHNSYEYDIALLINAFNIAASISSFLISSIKFNDKLKNFWEYDIYRICEKFLWLHHHLYKFDIKYKIHTMKSSDIYARKMFKWYKSKSQLKLMLEDNCTYDFVLIKPNT